MRRLRLRIAVGVVALCALLASHAQPVLAVAVPAGEISTSATPARVTSGHGTTRSGTIAPVGPTVEVHVKAAAYPSSDRVRAAARYLARRAGTKAFAVIDSHGRLAGVDMHRRFHSASVVKSMLLVAYLQMLADERRSVDRPARRCFIR